VPQQPAALHRRTEPEMMVGQHDGDFGICLWSCSEALCGQEYEDRGRGSEVSHGYAIARAASRA